MPYFGQASLAVRATVKAPLVRLFDEVIKTADCTLKEGRRSWERQGELYYGDPKRTHLAPGESIHNPPKDDPYALVGAIDVYPYPVKWPEWEPKGSEARRLIWARLYTFSGFVWGVAVELGIPIRRGADWDGDLDMSDQSFHDLPHFELVGG